MPIFDLKCKVCEKVLNDELVLSHQSIPVCCGSEMTKMPSRMLIGFPVGGLTLTNVEEKPVHFSSRKELVRYKNENNLELGALPND